MMFSWNDRTRQWMEDASAWTGYCKNLARLLLDHIPVRGSLCDMGCGLGLVDFELAPSIGEITCVDVADYAVESVRARAERLGVNNITAVKGDGLETEGRWDTILALFHGSSDRICRKYLSMANDRLIFVTHGGGWGHTGPGGVRIPRCSSVAKDSAWLDGQGVVYTLVTGELEFGQPHRSFEDAVAYHREFNRKAPEDELIPYVRKAVRETGRDDFPLYTPKKRDFGMFVIRRGDNGAYLSRSDR